MLFLCFCDYVHIYLVFSLLQFRRNIANVDEVYRKFFITDETRYNEVVLVADYEMVTSPNRAVFKQNFEC